MFKSAIVKLNTLKSICCRRGLVLSILALAGAAFGQSVTIYVNGTTGSDSNPGTASQPLKTISAATAIVDQNVQQGVASTVIVYPGTYRETLTLNDGGLSVVPPTSINAYQPGTVTISGADVWTGWQAYGANPSVFTHSWPYKWGLCPIPSSWPAMSDIVRRREMIIVNGTPLTQVLALNQMTAGTFFVNETNATAYVWPPAGTVMSSATVEIATRSRVLWLNGTTNVTISNLNFQYGNSCVSQGAAFLDGPANLVIQDSTFQWNNAWGLDNYYGTNETFQRVKANNNGEGGFGGYGMSTLLYDTAEASNNNWRGAAGGFTDWEPAGGKFFYLNNATFRNWKSVANQGRGLWFDTDNVNVTVDHSVFLQNTDGIFIEANPGPISITNSTICNNSNEGILNGNSNAVTLQGNVIYNNQDQLMISGDDGGRVITDQNGQPLTLYSQNWVLQQNTIQGASAAQTTVATTLSSDWAGFTSTLNSNTNSWYNAYNRQTFQVPDPTDFPGWKAMTGQDANSSFAPPTIDAAAACSQAGGTTGSVVLSASPTSQTVTAGGAATFQLGVARSNYTGAVNLSASSVPAGMTVTFQPSSVTGNSATVTVQTAAGAPSGTTPLTINGAAAGITVAPVNIGVTVNPAPASVGLSVSPASQTVSRGQSTTYTITIARTNFTGAVNLAVSGLPTGAVASFSPNPATGTSATLTVNAGASTQTGAKTLTITGSASGITIPSITAGLTVNLPSISMPQTISGNLSSASDPDPNLAGAFKDDYRLVASAGQRVQIDMTSTFDSFLRLIDGSSGAILAENDDTSGTNARITFTVRSGVNYIVRATSYAAGAGGAYTLQTRAGKPRRDSAAQ